MAKKVLFITYYFPPAGGPNAQRVVKLIRHLPEYGWEPVVLTVRNGAYPMRDASLFNELPEGLRIYRTRSWNPYGHYAKFTGAALQTAIKIGSMGERQKSARESLAHWIRANLFLPDARIGWTPFAVSVGKRILAEAKIDAILSTGPPHSTHLTGLALHRCGGAPWAADFQDPWVDINYYHELPHSRWALKADVCLEKKILQNASALVTVSPAWKRLLANKTGGGDDALARISVVHNGFEPSDFDSDPHPCPARFEITYAGSLYRSRNPIALWAALQQLREQGEIPKLRIRLIGKIDSSVAQSLDEHGLTPIARQTGYLSHREAIACMRASSLLLFVIERFPADNGMITAKLFQYLASGRPIIGVGPPLGDAFLLLQKAGAGQMFGHEDAAGMMSYLRRHYSSWLAGRQEEGAAAEFLRPYSWQKQAATLAGVLNGLHATKN